MAILTPTTKQAFKDACAEVGIPDERAEDIYAVAASGPVTTDAQLQAALNLLGYYDEKVQHLKGKGVTVG